MKWFRENKAFKMVWLLLAIHILNASIDPPDAHPQSEPEDLSYNEIESFAELVAEDMMDIENAMPEHDEQDNDDGTPIGSKKICEFYEKKITNTQLSHFAPINKNQNEYYINLYSFDYNPEVNLPPEVI